MPRARDWALPLLAALAVVLATDSVRAEGGRTTPALRTVTAPKVQVGERPRALAAGMDDGALKQALLGCADAPMRPTPLSIGHRGAPLRYPEHTREGYVAAARMGAGVLECDVTFTKDRALVCRHSQCDLHTTTNVLAVPVLAAKCSQPFEPATDTRDASAECCTTDFTLAELRQLCGKRDAFNARARTPAEYIAGDATADAAFDARCGTLVSHDESIALFEQLGVMHTPELKAPEVDMPFDGEYSQEAFAQQMIDAYKVAGVHPSRVFAQSFDLDDVLYWVRHEPAFGRQAVYLDNRVERRFGYAAAVAGMKGLRALGVRIVAPPMFALVELDEGGRIVPSDYARAARRAGLKLITWTLERSGSLRDGGGAYYRTVSDAIDDEGDVYTMLHALVHDVGVIGVFSDWPATVTYYANCMDE